MSDRSETVADVVAEMRGNFYRDGKVDKGAMDCMKRFAARIEAAIARVQEIEDKPTRNETVADVVHDMKSVCKGTLRSPEETHWFADRIEKAWKREKSNLVEKAASEKRWADHYFQKWQESGNLMKMREALEYAIARAEEARNYLLRSADTKACMEELINVAREAIAEPPRNCDRFSNHNYAVSEFEKDTGYKEPPPNDKTSDTFWWAFGKWLYATAQEGGAK